jgi:hypothetical protein
MFDPLNPLSAATSMGPAPNGPGPQGTQRGRDVSRDMVESRMAAAGGCSCSSGMMSKRTKVVLGLAAIGTAVYLWRR